MGVPKVRLMKTNEDNTKDQVYPITHIDAIDGLKEVLKGKELNLGVKTINGKSGDIVLPVLNDSDYIKIMKMVDAYEKGEIGNGGSGTQGPKGDPGIQGPKGDKGDKGNSGDNNITFTKVGTV